MATTSNMVQHLLALWVVLLSLVGMGNPVAAQIQSGQASDEGTAYFHRAAQHYLAGDEEAARAATEAGLDVAPNHAKLQALRERLEALPPEPSTSDQGAEGEGTDEGESDASSESPPGDTDPSDSESDASEEEDASPPQSEEAPADTDRGTPEANGTGAEEPGADAPESNLSQPPETSASEDPGAGEGEPPTGAESLPSLSEPPSVSTQIEPRLTREQAEQLLRLVEAQDQPLMRAMRSFGAEQTSAPDW